jgi:hypothetical protein
LHALCRLTLKPGESNHSICSFSRTVKPANENPIFKVIYVLNMGLPILYIYDHHSFTNIDKAGFIGFEDLGTGPQKPFRAFPGWSCGNIACFTPFPTPIPHTLIKKALR